MESNDDIHPLNQGHPLNGPHPLNMPRAATNNIGRQIGFARPVPIEGARSALWGAVAAPHSDLQKPEQKYRSRQCPLTE